MQKHYLRRFVPAALALVLGGQVMAATPSIADLPGCRGSLGNEGIPACRFRTEVGMFDPGSLAWTTFDDPGEAFHQVFRYASHPLHVRSLTPLGTVDKGDEVTYSLQFDAGIDPSHGKGDVNDSDSDGGIGAVHVSLWLGDDQGKHRTALVERTITFGGDAIGPVRLSASGADVGFEPNYLYVEFNGVDDVKTADGFPTRRVVPVVVQNVTVGIRPTESR